MEISFQEKAFSKRSKAIILATALLQGFLLFYLYKFVFKNEWFADHRVITHILSLLSVFIPTTIILTFRQSDHSRWYWFFIVGLAIVLSIFGWHLGSILGERGSRAPLAWLFSDGAFYIILVLWFKACFFLKGYLHEDKRIASYPTLFGYSWHNFLTLSLSYLFALIFFGILMLWAGLFKIVEIDFFNELFTKEWFLYPVLSCVIAYGIILLRTQVNAVGTIQRILRILLSGLLPILIIIALLFVAVLPFTGIGLIWEKGYGSGVILGFLYVTLFFFNAVYQDGSENPYNEKISLVIKYAVSVLLIFCALCFYGLLLRVQQYGWTEDRLWLATLTLIATSYVVLYSIGIFFKKESWSEFFGKSNTVMALAVMLLLFLILTPIMSFKKISAQSQYDRFISGAVSAKNFDYAYVSRTGKYGKEKLLLLKEHEDIKDNTELLAEVELSLKGSRWYARRALTLAERIKLIEVYPQASTVDQKVWTLLEQQMSYGCQKGQCFIVQYDLNGDQKAETLFFKNTSNESYSITFIEQREGQYFTSNPIYGAKLNNDVIKKIKRLEVSLKEPKWPDLYVDEVQIPFNKNTNN